MLAELNKILVAYIIIKMFMFQIEGAAINSNCVHWVHLTDLPNNVELHKIKSRLYAMASKTKGTVIYISKKLAIIQYTQPTTAER